MKKMLAAPGLGVVLTAGTVLAQDCKPSKYGPNDEIGAATW